MTARVLDIAAVAALAVPAVPLIAIGVLLVKLGSPGPVFYRARRVGRYGRIFEMLKLRTMHVTSGGPAITGPRDARVFPAGSFLRAAKIDELPQLINILRGEMSIVGPRPEDPQIVADHYKPWMHDTLAVRPGVTSPGAVFGYLQGEALLDDGDPTSSYVARVLPPKLAIERCYIRRATLLSDLGVIAKTGLAVALSAAGRNVDLVARDRRAAERFLDEVDAHTETEGGR